jgi:PKD repeat protein
MSHNIWKLACICLILLVFPGCIEQQSLDVSQDLPACFCSANVYTGPAPLNVSFTSEGSDDDNPLNSYYWDFGDGGTSIKQKPKHTYHTPGIYTVTFTGTDRQGNQHNNTLQITVFQPQNMPPIARASADITVGTAPLTVAFHGSGTDTNGAVVSYQWDFGDSSTERLSLIRDPIHTFSKEGVYTVTLTVRDNKGATSEDTVTISVYPSHSAVNFAIEDVTVTDTLEIAVDSLTSPLIETLHSSSVVIIALSIVHQYDGYLRIAPMYLIDDQDNKYTAKENTISINGSLYPLEYLTLINAGKLLQASDMIPPFQHVVKKLVFEIPHDNTPFMLSLSYGRLTEEGTIDQWYQISLSLT